MDDMHRDVPIPTDVPLSPAVRRLVADATDESARLDHEYIGTEHIVLALSRPGRDSAELRALSVEPTRVYELINETVRHGHPIRHELERPFTSRTKNVFSFAEVSAHKLGHSQIDVADLLVGLMKERVNIGAQVLADQGLTLEQALELAQRRGAQEQMS
jgi:ATP-dependent Clp protease ATP-binding subunit ClpC